jgi:succinate-semialdehyde dehydrogenase / glutarate-semialdehyde dehydrogenase
MKKFNVYNPSTGAIIQELESFGYDYTVNLIKQAQAKFIEWKNLLPSVRAEILENWYQLVKENQNELANILSQEQGKPFAEALNEIEYGNSFIKYYAQEASRVFGEISTGFRANQWSINILEPIGVVAAITPWNFPCAMVTKKIAPAIASGCPIILKPSEETPLTAIKLHELAIKAGVWPEVFSICYGDYEAIGKAFIESDIIKMITFTGSINVGKYLMQESAKTVKKLVLELGGNAPCIVFNDADLELAAKKIMLGKLRNAGQACTSPNRIFVEQSILDKFLQVLQQELELKQYNIGPLINHNQKNKAQNLVNNAINNGAKIYYQATTPNQQNSELYFAPMIVSELDDDMELVKDEAFAPIFSVLSFNTEDEVLNRANNTTYGLAAYLFSKDLKKTIDFSHKLNFGVIAINDSGTAHAQTVHGGFNQSGLGREGGRAGLMEYFESKFIAF